MKMKKTGFVRETREQLCCCFFFFFKERKGSESESNDANELEAA